MSLLALIGLALALGVRHACDADHVVAVTAIAARHRRVGPAMLVGALWGLGHTLTISLVGALIIVFNLSVPPRVGLSFEFAVGIALTVVGALNVSGRGGFLSAGVEDGSSPSWRAFLVGIVHGLAGSAAVALLVLATVRDTLAAIAYLLVFGLGTVLGMTLVTLSTASPAALLARRFEWSGSWLRTATGVLSLAFGLYVMVEAGWTGGLLRGGTPQWTPR